MRAYASGIFLFDVLDRLVQRRDERDRVTQHVLGQLKFRNQDSGFVYDDESIGGFAVQSSFSYDATCHEPTIVEKRLRCWKIGDGRRPIDG
jgi:hypothetical protein